MKQKILFLLTASCLYAHVGGYVTNDMSCACKEDEERFYGGFLNFSYRDKDLYPKGIPQAYGYENHGNPNQVVLEHIGFYGYNRYGDIEANLEVNHHTDSKWTANELFEKFNVSYAPESLRIEAGRDYNAISFVKEKKWGYGFIQMPLAIDSFFDKTHTGDGLFFTASGGGLVLSADAIADQYNHKKRTTVYGGYRDETWGLFAYAQERAPLQTKQDFATLKHTHTHATGCNDFLGDEACIQNDTNIWGIGTQIDLLKRYEILSEYLHYKSDGEITDIQYRVTHHTAIESIYAQITSKNPVFNYGLRGEYFRYDMTIDGSGAIDIADKIGLVKEKERVKYLYTLNINYTILSHHTFAFELKTSNQDNAIRLNYLLQI